MPSQRPVSHHAPTFVNVVATAEEEARIQRVDASWTAPRLISLLAVTLGLALLALYGLASW